jgi:hypothetical protein
MVNLWWIAGESWQVDGHFSGSKNTPLFPDLFLVDSHFGNAYLGWSQPCGCTLGTKLFWP